MMADGNMIEKLIVKLFEETGLGTVELPLRSVSGGLMHRMYKVRAGGKEYAVKHLNPQIMKRPEALSNFERAERLESLIEDAGIPIIPALCFSGRKMLNVDGEYFSIFDWFDGSITDWNEITDEQCNLAGSILGRMHALDPKSGEKSDLDDICIDLDSFMQKAEKNNKELFALLSENKTLIRHAEAELNKARKILPDIVCISDEDMDPKNVMWKDGQPRVIDLECLEYGNPVSHVLQLSLQWSGINPGCISSFFDGYLKEYDNGFRRYSDVFGISYSWLEWLEYNIDRALGACADENENELANAEVRCTLDRIRYLYDNETKIRSVLEAIR